MVCVPTVRLDVVSVAWPVGPRTTAARVVAPSVNVTVPVGATPADGPFVTVTVAVNVTACPKIDGFGDDVRVVAVSASMTTWSTEPALGASSCVPE